MTPEERAKLVDEIKFTIAIGVARGFNYPYIAEQVLAIAERAFAKDIEAAYKDGWWDNANPYSTESKHDYDYKWSDARAAIAAIRPHIEAAERERCAKVAEGFPSNRDWVPGSLWGNIRNEIAAAIRSGK